MKLLLLTFSVLLFIPAMPPKKQKVIFFGDSITQAAVKKDGFIDLMQRELKAKGLENNYELIGAGIGGNKVYDLYLRLEDDVLSKKPDVVFIYVGINDVWHKMNGTGTDLDKYEKFYNALITKIQSAGAKVILCTPTMIGELKDNANQQDEDLEKYSDVVRKLAASRNCELVDLRKDFQDYIKTHNPDNQEKGILTTDRVHLNQKGNELVAKAMMKKL